ncbi:mitochondrial export translocase Oxa2, putative [Trichophyton benhamiae CBS 112371]|uniref:Mitochondrial export translocase Oxa2, putative n=1 Tax=Arthroderma benhamiae (strain ATCC MYA-4681 / CBS 112371) TaxID=663331 RepID=D4AV13_ARTBC|nr:mitochondrial export translocase Oxa2, putative [Trichophyton benhamiae CBS 112371]EFE32935.1 mitochondrial export translocase Oxa2, putative [Trichophyton benhamiae CBS 112371]
MSLMWPRPGFSVLSSLGCGRVSIAAPSRRNFHASNPNQIIDTSVLVAHDVIQGFHSISGLPWVLSIPITAITVRCCVALPLQVWSILKAQQLQKLNPLLLTWSRVCQKKAMDEAIMEGRHLFPKAIEVSWQQDFKIKRKELYKRWKIRPWAGYASILQLPVWLAMMESLRRMVGMSGGLLSIIQSWIESKVDGAPIIEIEPSMAMEGALWFPDLLVADPIHVLPVVLAASMFTNVTWGWKVKSAAEISKLQRSEAIRERSFKILKRVLQGLSIWLAPVMIYSQAPAGLLIYWISSSTFATAQTQIVRRVMRTKAPPAPCREKSVGSIHDKTSTAFK